MNRVQLKELSKSQLKGSWKMPIILTVLYLAISMVVGFIQEEVYSSFVSFLMLILVFGIGIWSTVGIPNFYLEFIKKGGEVELKDALVSTDKLVKSLVYNIIIGVITFVVSFITILCASLGTIFAVLSTDNMGLLLFVGGVIVVALSVGFIILSVALAQVPYIILETNVGAIQAMKISIKMMKGNKWRYFVLYLSFIGWAILSTLTFGIGFLWLIPYVSLTFTNFYKDISNNFEI